MADIEVRREEGAGPTVFAVRVSEGETATEHRVSMGDADLERLAGGYPSAEDFMRACFEFLLAREPKEQILERFDVSVIARYFPEFEEEIRRGSG
jgi:hypothetical protein